MFSFPTLFKYLYNKICSSYVVKYFIEVNPNDSLIEYALDALKLSLDMNE